MWIIRYKWLVLDPVRLSLAEGSLVLLYLLVKIRSDFPRLPISSEYVDNQDMFGVVNLRGFDL